MGSDLDASHGSGGAAPEAGETLTACSRAPGILVVGTLGAGGRPTVWPLGGAPEPATDAGAEPAVTPLGAALAAEAPLVLLGTARVAKCLPPNAAVSSSGPWSAG